LTAPPIQAPENKGVNWVQFYLHAECVMDFVLISPFPEIIEISCSIPVWMVPENNITHLDS
jgi:hypothetical protein